MSRATRLAKKIECTVTGPMWHGPALAQVLEMVTHEEAAARPIAGAHTVWEIVRHVTTWAEIARPSGSSCEEAPALVDCLVALGSDALLQELHDAFEKRPSSMCYATLQGRGDGDVRGAIALRRGRRCRCDGGLLARSGRRHRRRRDR